MGTYKFNSTAIELIAVYSISSSVKIING